MTRRKGENDFNVKQRVRQNVQKRPKEKMDLAKMGPRPKDSVGKQGLRAKQEIYHQSDAWCATHWGENCNEMANGWQVFEV